MQTSGNFASRQFLEEIMKESFVGRRCNTRQVFNTGSVLK